MILQCFILSQMSTREKRTHIFKNYLYMDISQQPMGQGVFYAKPTPEMR